MPPNEEEIEYDSYTPTQEELVHQLAEMLVEGYIANYAKEHGIDEKDVEIDLGT